MPRLSKKYFPFSPGVPWTIKNSKYILPQMTESIFYNKLKGKDIIVACFGGLIESYLSLTILETINYMMPGNKLFWCGNGEFHSLIKRNGLAKFFSGINSETLDRFPTPFFFDKENRVYFNSLYNYINVKTYYLEDRYISNKPIIKQIIENSTVDWNVRYLPQIRINTGQHKSNVLIFPDKTGMSQHNSSCLGWSVKQTRMFAKLMNSSGMKPIIITNNIEHYIGYVESKTEVIKLDLDRVIDLLPHSYAVVSEDVDFLILANIMSAAKLFSLPQPKHLSLIKNNKFLGKNNDIYMVENLSPEFVWSKLTSLEGQCPRLL